MLVTPTTVFDGLLTIYMQPSHSFQENYDIISLERCNCNQASRQRCPKLVEGPKGCLWFLSQMTLLLLPLAWRLSLCVVGKQLLKEDYLDNVTFGLWWLKSLTQARGGR
jgi:hypothetical protein